MELALILPVIAVKFSHHLVGLPFVSLPHVSRRWLYPLPAFLPHTLKLLVVAMWPSYEGPSATLCRVWLSDGRYALAVEVWRGPPITAWGQFKSQDSYVALRSFFEVQSAAPIGAW